MNIHTNIQELRKKAGMSQEALAEQLGVSRQAVSKWESGASTPDLDKILLIAEIFSVSVSELLTGEKEEQTPAPAPVENTFDAEKYEEMINNHLLQVDEMLRTTNEKKRSFIPLIAACLCLVVAVYFAFYYMDKVRHLEDDLSSLQSNLDNIQSNVGSLESNLGSLESNMGSIRSDINHHIYSIRQEISDSLKKEYGMVSDYSIEYRDADIARRTVVLDISVSPRLWNEGDVMTFIIEADGMQNTVEGTYSNGTVSVSASVPLTDEIHVSACITNGYTTKQEKLDSLRSLLSMHLLSVDGYGSILSTHTEGSDKMALSGSVLLTINAKTPGSPSAKSQIKSASLEFIENGSTTQTVNLLKEAQNVYDSTSLAVFADFVYEIEPVERTIHPGDVYEFKVTLIDNNGVTYQSILERIDVLDNLSVQHDSSNHGTFEIILP